MSTITITNNANSSRVSVEVTPPTNITLQEKSISVVKVSSIGPQGPQGPQGEQGPSGSSGVYATSTITTAIGNVSTSFNYYGVNYAGSVRINLPDPTGEDGYNVVIKDESGNASTNVIDIIPTVGLIDGNSSVLMTRDYMALTLVARNNNWWII